MLREIINRLRGQVRLRVRCPYPERVLNVCSARNLAFWDLTWEDAETFTCRISRKDFHLLRQAAEKLDCRLEVVGREGVPYALARLRRRQALAVGSIVCGMALVIGSFFIWDIQITGNETVPKEAILQALEHNGVTLGRFGMSLDGEDIRNHVLLELPALSWINVNVSGCRAKVEVRERRPAPALLDRREPCNLVARRDGLVLRVQALGGTAAVLRGMSVTRGQLLISGVEDTAPYGARLTAGLGRVEGRTWYTLTVNVPLTEAAKRYTGGEKRLRSLIFGTRRIKFFSNSSIDAGKCDKMTVRTPVCVFGLPLPVTLETETLRFYETEIVACDPAQRQAETGAVLEQYLHSLVDAYGTVTAAQVSSRVRGDVLTVTLSAECREELGTRVPIYTTEEPGGAPG